MSLESKLLALKERSCMLDAARSFFRSCGLIEVDTPLLSPYACVDAHIDLIQAKMSGSKAGYLHSSPEYAMKRLIASGLGNIFQISHVFRYAEVGPLHNPEFTMAEWYKKGISFHEMIEMTLDFIKLFTGPQAIVTLSYKELFQQYAGLSLSSSCEKTLRDFIYKKEENPPSGLELWDRDTLLQYIGSFYIEPRLSGAMLHVITHFPASQAALSQVVKDQDGDLVAKRFEVYCQGIELANGYHELASAEDLEKRLQASNQQRVTLGKEPLPYDPHLIAALEKGLGDCCGVAAGFDRLMMLHQKSRHIKEVIPFSWEELL
jgi:lysyl-tRNA synthetase class 2